VLSGNIQKVPDTFDSATKDVALMSVPFVADTFNSGLKQAGGRKELKRMYLTGAKQAL
jgi:hypothetical protein